MGRQAGCTKSKSSRNQTLTFTIDVIVDPAAIVDTHGSSDGRTPATVVADEITSNLESVSYVKAVSVRRKTT